ncbi:MAG: hypothetical protein HQ485_14290 [Acidobacteria bacterium]|jgi:hypothetical protein|nr:hypothetical protein [Acidobacteriota bacterium]
MGKRELLIVLAFVLVGAAVFQFAAPPDTGTSSFSFGEFFRAARTEMRGDPGEGSFAHKEALPAPPSLREIRLIGVSHGVQVVGEDRDTIGYEFTVNSSGPDDPGAVELAKQTILVPDDLGDVLVLRATYPDAATQRSSVVLHLPRRLAISIEGGRGITVSHVAGVHLESVRGDVVLTDLSGPVTGVQGDGDFTLTGAWSIKMRLTRSQSKLSHISNGVILDIRDGDVTIADSDGDLEIDEVRADVTVDDHGGSVTVRGSGGHIVVQRPSADTRVDVRRAEVELLIDRGISATLITTDEPLRLVLSGTLAVSVDAAATNGSIQATEVGLTADESKQSDTRTVTLSHTFGTPEHKPAGARITLRNTRGDIVIRKRS